MTCPRLTPDVYMLTLCLAYQLILSVVVSDTVLSTFDVEEICCIHAVHYSPPSKKGVFRMRLSFFFKAMLL